MRPAPYPFTLRQAQYAVAVADLRSFRRAAELCRVSQPALSSQLAGLEEGIGARLFERDRRRVLPTPAGAEIVDRLRRLLVEADDLVDAAHALADPMTGALRLGILPTIAPYLLPDAVRGLRKGFPRLSLRWVEDRTAALVSALRAGDLDGAVVALESDVGGLEHAEIGRDEFVLAVPRGHVLSRSLGPVRAAELDGEPVLLLADGHCFRDQALAFCSRAGADELGFRATSLSTLAQMAAGGAGVTLLPRLSVPIENRRGALVVRPFAPPAPARTLALVWRPRSPLAPALKPLAAALGESLRRVAAARASPGSPVSSGISD
jgi:LysR family hydrogen peroxide-inducible transcriptional activator